MSFKDFKKTHEDEQTVTFSHKSGSKLAIPKKMIKDKGLLEQLNALPLHASEGVEVPDGRQSAPLPDQKQALADYAQKEENALPADSLGGQRIPAQAAVTGDQPTQPPTGPSQDDIGMPGANLPGAEPSDLSPNIQGPDSAMAAAQDPKQELDGEAVKTQQDLMSGHIKPETYQSLFAKKDTLGKIGTLFGLLISGAGSGLAHQPNAVMEMMNNEIKNDLDAQKTTASNAQNLYHLNQQNEFNKANIGKTKQESGLIGAQTKGADIEADIKANQLAYQQAILFTNHHVQGLVDKMPPGNQKAAAQSAANNMQAASAAEIAQGNQKAANQISSVRGSDPEAAFKARQAQMMAGPAMGMPGLSQVGQSEAEKHVPGVGDASIPVPANVRAELVSHQKLQNAGQDLLKYSKEHTNLIPGTPEYNTGVQKAHVMQQMVREGLLGTVFRESEKPLLNSFVGENPAGALKMLSTQPKLKALIESNKMAGDTLKQAYGLPTESSDQNSSEVRYDKQGNAWKMGPNGKPVRAK